MQNIVHYFLLFSNTFDAFNNCCIHHWNLKFLYPLSIYTLGRRKNVSSPTNTEEAVYDPAEDVRYCPAAYDEQPV